VLGWRYAPPTKGGTEAEGSATMTHQPISTYCGNYPELGHAGCASSVECTAFCGSFYGASDTYCTAEAGHAGDHTAPTGDDDGVWAWEA
jgi:hypothetical protein